MEPRSWLAEGKNCSGKGTCLVEDAAIVWRNIVGVKEDAFLYWTLSVMCGVLRIGRRCLRRLKLVTGVDISTRPVRRSGKEGKAKKKMSLKTAAEVKRMAFRRSITMTIDECSQ